MGIIGSIRKHSWVAVTIVGIAIVAFIIGDLTKNQRGIPDLGKINNTTITSQHFNELVEEMEANYKAQQGVAQIPSDVEYQIREQVWQNVVEENLMDVEFSKLGLTVSAAEVSDMFNGKFIHPYLRQIFTNPQNGQYDYDRVNYLSSNFDQLDTATREQWMEIEKFVKKDRMSQKYSNLIAAGFYTPKALVADMAKFNANSSDVRVAMVPFQAVSDEDAVISDADFKAYYDQHKNEYRMREEVRELQFVTFPLVPTAADQAQIAEEVQKTWEEFQTISDDEIAFFVNAESDRTYDSSYMKASEFAPLDSVIAGSSKGAYIAPRVAGNQWVMAKVLESTVRPDSLRASAIYVLNDKAGAANVTRSDEQAKHLADSIAAILKANKMNFEEAVAQFSDDPQKNDNKGDMGWQLDGNYGFLNDEILNTPVNGIFVYRHPNEVGYFVVKVTDKSAAQKKYRVAMVTRDIVPSEATERNIYNIANKFAGDNRTYDEMIAAAQKENFMVRNGMVNHMSNTLPGLTNARSIVQWAYNEDSEAGMVADQVFESDDNYIVVALKEVYKVGYPTLDQLRPNIEQQVRLEKKGEVLMARAEEALKAGKDINSIAVKLGTTVDTIQDVTLGQYYFDRYGMEPKVQAAIAVNKGNNLLGPIKGAQGVYMVQVDATTEKPVEDVDALRSSMEQAGMQRMRGLVQVLKDNAKIIDQRNKFF